MKTPVMAVLATLALAGPSLAAEPGGWLASWGASPAFPVGPELNGETVRQFVRLSVGGHRIRVRFSNETGMQPLVIGNAHVARPGNAPGSVDTASDRVLTFGGASSVTVPPGAPMVSDPVEIDAGDLSKLAISLFIGRWSGPAVVHPDGVETTYMAPGDQTAAAGFDHPRTSLARVFLSAVEVESGNAGTVVTFGDSITDGYHSTTDADRRWPDRLAERLAAQGATAALGVVNAGLSGNRVLHDHPEDVFGPSALARFDRDALAQSGVRWVVVMEGINDIGHPTSSGLRDQTVSADEIIGGYKQLLARAHAARLKVFGATLTPFEGTVFPGYFTADGEAKRQAVNQWIRTSGAYDGVIDFDAALRDPAHPSRMRAEFDEGDHLHPNDAGYKAMADAVDLGLFK